MNEEKYTIKKKITDFNTTEEEIRFLSYNSTMLVPCEFEVKDEIICFKFNIEGLSSIQSGTEAVDEKYRFLANCADLYNLCEEFEFSMKPDNLMCDINLCPKILIRDKRNEQTKSNFLKKYKSLSAAVLNSRYTYDNYYNGGDDLFKKNPQLNKIKECSNIKDLKKFFLNCYESNRRKEKANKVLVNKRSKTVIKAVIPVLSVIVVSLGILALIAYIQMIPFRDTMLRANESYFSENYIEVQRALENISLEKLPFSQKYILARSYVFSESMTQKQKEIVLDGITMNTDEAVINYWVYIGRLDFDKAIDQALKIDDEELLLYAYIKQRSALKDDSTISGEEKTEKVNAIEEKITSITGGMKDKTDGLAGNPDSNSKNTSEIQ